MAETQSLSAILAVHDQSFSSGLKKAERNMATFSKSVEQKAIGMQKAYVNSVTNIAKQATKLATVGVVAFTSLSVNAAAEAQVVEAQYAQAFKGVENQANATLNTLSKTFNILPERLKAPMASLQSYFKGTGMDASSALNTTTNAMAIAADAAAYYDKSIEDVYGSLKGFLMGNFENGDALGVNTNLTKIATAYNKEYQSSFKDLSDAAQTDYLLEYIENIYKASGVTGQATRESEEWGNVLGNLQKSLEILATTVGTPMLAPLIKGMQELTSLTLTTSDNIGTMIAEMSKMDSLGDQAKYIWDLIEPLHELLAVGAAGTGLAALLPLLGQLGSGFSILTGGLAGLGTTGVAGIGSLASSMGGLKGIIGGLTAESTGMMAGLLGLSGTALSVVGIAGTATLGVANTTIQGLAMIGKASMTVFNIAAIAGVVLAGMGYFYQTFQSDIDAFIANVVSKGPAIVEGLLSGIVSKIPALVDSGAQLLAGIFQMVEAIGPVALEGGMNIIYALVEGITSNSGIITDGISKLFTFILTSVGTHLPTIFLMGAELLNNLVLGLIDNQDMISDGFGTLLNGMTTLVTEGLPLLFEIGKNIITFIVNGLTENSGNLMNFVVTLLTTFINEFIQFLPFLVNMGARLIVSLVQGLWDNRQPLIDTAKNLFNTLLLFLVEGVPKLVTMGLNFVLKLVQGIVDNKDTIATGAESMIYALIGALFHMLVASGREFGSIGWEIGKTLMSGLIDSVLDEMTYVKDVVLGGMSSIGEFFGVSNNQFNASDWNTSVGKDRTSVFIPPVQNGVTNTGRNVSPYNLTMQKEPAHINLAMNSSTFNGFSDDINNSNERQTQLRANY